jgi:hypothetical protein
MPKRNPEPELIEFNGAFQNTATGEMFVPASDQSGKLLATGYFFERVTQGQPHVLNMEGPRVNQVRPSPWQWASQYTAVRVSSMLSEYLPLDVELTIQAGDKNTQFPYSHDQLYIRGKRGARKMRINAGLLANNIARSTAFLDGEVKQFPRPCLEATAAELLRGLEEPKDE